LLKTFLFFPKMLYTQKLTVSLWKTEENRNIISEIRQWWSNLTVIFLISTQEHFHFARSSFITILSNPKTQACKALSSFILCLFSPHFSYGWCVKLVYGDKLTWSSRVWIRSINTFQTVNYGVIQVYDYKCVPKTEVQWKLYK